jgi:transcriptional regulator with XRE-family HTH domain
LKTLHRQAYETLIRRMKEARKGARITQTVLAGILGRPQSFVSKYESHERLLDPIEFLEIALVIGIDPYSLLKECEAQIQAIMPRRKPHSRW